MQTSRLLPSLVVTGLAILPIFTAEGRTFTDKTGRKIEAEIISKQGTQLRIKLANGQDFPLDIQNLSPADQEYAKTWQPAGAGAGAAPPAAADARAKPGTVVALEFPTLPADLNGNKATCNVWIPAKYEAGKPVPLLVWIGGGKGGNTPGGGYALVNKDEFAVAALPYPSNAPTPMNAMLEGKMDEIWKYHQVMLAEVRRLLPNIDPKIRIVAGFSNGAHTIGCHIRDGTAEFADYFNAFVIIEGGSDQPGAKKRLRDKFAYLAWGLDTANKGSEGYMQNMVGAAKDARLETTTHGMEGVGHAFPDSEKAAVKSWIEKTVIPGLTAVKGR